MAVRSVLVEVDVVVGRAPVVAVVVVALGSVPHGEEVLLVAAPSCYCSPVVVMNPEGVCSNG